MSKYFLIFHISREVSLSISKTTRNNGTLYIHTIVLPSKRNNEDLSLNEAVRATDSTYLKNSITQYTIPKTSTFNLLNEEIKAKLVKPVTHLRTKYSILICNDKLNLPHSNIPYEVINLIRINNKKQFLPMLTQDFFQTRLRDLEEITPETKTAKVIFSYNPATIGKFKFLMQMQLTFHHFLSLGFTEKDVDEVKGVFADTNVYLLCATVFIGSVHVSVPNNYIFLSI